MSSKSQVVQVFIHWDFADPILVGTLAIESKRGHESYAFEYSADWLSSPDAFSIDPELELFPGRQYSNSSNGFGVFSDSAPDRWGRTLLKRRERIRAQKENRPVCTLLESDFLLGIDDTTRMGAFRFSNDNGETFLDADGQNHEVPPMANLSDLENAARGYELQEGDGHWIPQLVRPGSSLGGARPKANVKDEDGSLWIAKFPSKYDETNIGAWEKAMIDLASLCEIQVPEVKLCNLSSYGSTFLSKRFDRRGETRIHFSSAMSLLGQRDGQCEEAGYLDLVDFLKSYGAAPKEDIKELFRRIVFSFAINNTDDHLRNHGFLLQKSGWILSPMYDVNPSLDAQSSSLNITPDNSEYTLENLLEFAQYTDLEKKWAEQTIQEICETVAANWKRKAYANGLTEKQIKSMEPAFRRAIDIAQNKN